MLESTDLEHRQLPPPKQPRILFYSLAREDKIAFVYESMYVLIHYANYQNRLYITTQSFSVQEAFASSTELITCFKHFGYREEQITNIR